MLLLLLRLYCFVPSVEFLAHPILFHTNQFLSSEDMIMVSIFWSI